MKNLISTAAISMLCVLFASSALAEPVYNAATGHWYEVNTNVLTWDQANAAATTFDPNADLVTVNDAAEQSWLVSTFGGATLFWIGLNDIVSEGIYEWTSGEAFAYSNWNGGEPNNCCGGEDRVVMNWDNPGKWNDWFSNSTAQSIVEWEAVPEAPTVMMFFAGLLILLGQRRKTGLAK